MMRSINTLLFISMFNNILAQNSHISDAYYEALCSYFVNKEGDDDIKKFGYILVVSTPNAFGKKFDFNCNNKRIRFTNPPYYEIRFLKPWRRNKGRHVYVIDSNLLPFDDTSKETDSTGIRIRIYDYIIEGNEPKNDFIRKKNLKMEVIYQKENSEWILIEKHKK